MLTCFPFPTSSFSLYSHVSLFCFLFSSSSVHFFSFFFFLPTSSSFSFLLGSSVDYSICSTSLSYTVTCHIFKYKRWFLDWPITTFSVFIIFPHCFEFYLNKKKKTAVIYRHSISSFQFLIMFHYNRNVIALISFTLNSSIWSTLFFNFSLYSFPLFTSNELHLTILFDQVGLVLKICFKGVFMKYRDSGVIGKQ